MTVLCNGQHVAIYLRVPTSSKSLRGCLRIYDMEDESTVKTEPRKVIRFYDEMVHRLYFDERYLVCVSQRVGARGCRLDIRSASNFRSLHHDFVPTAREELNGSFDYCNGWIVGQSTDQRTVHLWNMDTGHHQVIRHAGDIIYSLNCNANGQILTKSLESCRVWQVSRCPSQFKLLFCLQRTHHMEQLHKFDLFDGWQLVSVVRKRASRLSYVGVLQLNYDKCSLGNYTC